MNKRSYLLIAGLLVLTLSGCAHKSTKIKVEPIGRPTLVLPSPDQIIANPVHWYAVVKNAPAGQKGSIEYFFQHQAGNLGLAVSPDDFRNISKNNAQLRRLILQQQALLRAYKNYYEANK